MRPDLRAPLFAFLAALTALTLLPGCVPPLRTDITRADAYSSYRADDHQTALKLFQHAAQRDATDVKSHYYIGRIALDNLDDPGLARRHLEIAYTVNQSKTVRRTVAEPGSADNAVPYPSTRQIADALADAIHRLDNPPQLFGLLQEFIDTHGTVDDYLRMAHYLMLHRDPDAAVVHHLKAIKVRHPADALPYMALGDFYSAIGDREQALATFRKAFTINPTTPGLGDRIRQHGMVPGPTVGLPPDLD